jgi:AraC-like DNA-binding protein
MRGALSYADSHSHVVIRDFRMPLDLEGREGAVPELTALNAWKPQGMLSFLDNREFDAVLARLTPIVPIVSMAAVNPRPGVVLVGGSMPKMMEMAIHHFAGAMTFINQYACYGLTVERLRQETQRVSKMTFHKHFVAATGQTPGEAIRQRQFTEARRLLADTKLSITLVAEQSGFGSSSDFARAFRSAEGMTPRAYREHATRS